MSSAQNFIHCKAQHIQFINGGTNLALISHMFFIIPIQSILLADKQYQTEWFTNGNIFFSICYPEAKIMVGLVKALKYPVI